MKTRFRSAGEIRVGVIGYGASFNIARHHLNEMKRAGMTPVAVADIDPTRLPVAKADFPEVETYASATEMLARSPVDLVAICTPHHVHAPLAIECLEAGRHVVTEKPFAITTQECDAMIAAARRHRRVLSTYHNRHWDGWIMQAVEKIRAGLIGEVVRIEAHSCQYACPRAWWRSSKSISGGILYDWGAHFLEYALQILSGNMVEVTGFAHRGFWAAQTPYGDDTNEDELCALVRFDSGQWLTLFMSSIDSRARKGMLEVTGTRGSLIIQPETWEAICQEDGCRVVRSGPVPAGQSWQYYQNVVDHLVKGEPLVITPEYARRPIHIMDLAGQSAALGRSMPVVYP
ncbi:MAG: Gfo/Idh/MocA family oxidoreductase [Lentisphaerae bacterium]|nr:Gfo/Idh/MocA family oxidoreductase [Lentisphaerota bacterium]